MPPLNELNQAQLNQSPNVYFKQSLNKKKKKLFSQFLSQKWLKQV